MRGRKTGKGPNREKFYQIRGTSEELERLRQEARNRGVMVSKLVRQAINKEVGYLIFSED